MSLFNFYIFPRITSHLMYHHITNSHPPIRIEVGDHGKELSRLGSAYAPLLPPKARRPTFRLVVRITATDGSRGRPRGEVTPLRAPLRVLPHRSSPCGSEGFFVFVFTGADLTQTLFPWFEPDLLTRSCDLRREERSSSS